jgi:hypothetical protein
MSKWMKLRVTLEANYMAEDEHAAVALLQSARRNAAHAAPLVLGEALPGSHFPYLYPPKVVRLQGSENELRTRLQALQGTDDETQLEGVLDQLLIEFARDLIGTVNNEGLSAQLVWLVQNGYTPDDIGRLHPPKPAH